MPPTRYLRQTPWRPSAPAKAPETPQRRPGTSSPKIIGIYTRCCCVDDKPRRRRSMSVGALRLGRQLRMVLLDHREVGRYLGRLVEQNAAGCIILEFLQRLQRLRAVRGSPGVLAR